jgi:hypothetical protein
VQVDDATDGGVERKLSNFAAERQSADHRATVGIQHHGGARKVLTFGEKQKVARAIGGDRAGRRNPGWTFGAARVRRSLYAQVEAHRQRAVTRMRGGWQQKDRRR